ncbi:type IV toxin-antitoxin system AbiEi family antitoxin domain-containing protein [Paraburkholderia phenazinium]|uniref:type IV toxin-antitoxin system AbiEi family antitoxin domain-containing protein n=1 Tax=Paraburkholderia phenazinium TaxID=60549 RepID=UPI00265FDDB3|nr:type IV toxin-antitoxin system AbiEi family antitoxin domain-containing protein [Paraburkholderia phenazinium]
MWGAVPFEFPSWAKELLLLTYEHDRLFDDALPTTFAISALPARSARMPVAATERAILEYLAGSVHDERLHEDNVNLVGMLRNIRLDVLQKLVDHCPQRDVVWTLKSIGEDEDFEWAKQLVC